MIELTLELKNVYGKEGQKTNRRTFSGQISTELPSGNLYECPYCGLEDRDPNRHKEHVQGCQETQKVELISRGAMLV